MLWLYNANTLSEHMYHMSTWA